MIGRETLAEGQGTVIASYDQHYASAGQLRESDAFYRWVLSKLDPVPGRALLDVACGEGHLLRFATECGLSAKGVDFSGRAVQLARRAVGADVAVTADGQRLPFAEATFDYVTNLGSLEHFASPGEGLQEMRRVLRSEGLVALLLPNSYYLLDILWHVWRRGYPVSHRQPIERFATFGEWRDLILGHGFQVLRAFKYNLCFPRSVADVHWYARSPLKLAYVALSPVTPFHLSYSFLFLCQLR